MREGRRRPSLLGTSPGGGLAYYGRNEGGAPAPLVARTETNGLSPDTPPQ